MGEYWTSGRIRFALARYFNYLDHLMMTEWEIDGGIADMLFISRAGYATEIEIKISVSDWKADQNKGKFDRERPHVARFFYAVPEELADKVPVTIPSYAGILIVRSGKGLKYHSFDQVREIRAAIRRKAQKISEQEITRLYRSAYYRFWREEMKRQQRKLFDRPITNQMEAHGG